MLKFSVAMSVDGYVAGPNQSLEDPLGQGGEQLHQWAFATRSFRAMPGQEGGETGVDDALRDGVEREHRRRDHGPQHVRAGPRRLGRRVVARLVGRRTRRTTCPCSC